jgi:hypothetical protein
VKSTPIPSVPALAPQAWLPPAPGVPPLASAVKAPEILASPNTATITGRVPTNFRVDPALTVSPANASSTGPFGESSTGVGCGSLHQFVNVFVVESKIEGEGPQSKTATAVFGGLIPGVAGSKLVGGNGKLLRSHTPVVPLPPQTSGELQEPQEGKTPPQPSTMVPQFFPCAEHVVGVHPHWFG